MNTEYPYISAKINDAMEFKVFYPEVRDYPTIESLLESIPRGKIIRIAQLLVNIYGEAGFENVQKFFSPESSGLKEDFNNRINKFSNKEATYIFSSHQTSLELLRYAFSIEYIQRDLQPSEFEENLLKAILLINEELMDIKDDIDKISFGGNHILKIAPLFVANSFSNKDINSNDIHELYREIFTLSIDLFEHVSSDEYFKPIYEKFLENTGVRSYQEYMKTITSVFSLAFKDNKLGTFEYDKRKDPDNFIHQSVLDYISIPINHKISLIENEDYKVFRNKPLIKIDDNNYEVVNLRFLIERLFSSLYFDFKDIAKSIGITRFESEYTESFVEKVLLDKYINRTNRNGHYVISLSDEESKRLRNKNDSGEPDYYLKSKSGSVILFECKDILINSKIKVSRSSEGIIKEYKNKLLIKTYNNNGPIKKPQPIGIGQLVEQIYKIQKKKAFWDKKVKTTAKVYPVLVITDSKLLPDGMVILMQDWYEGNCRSKGINSRHAKPLIVLSISILLLYADEFSEKGLEHYFEQYYQYIANTEIDCSIDPLIKFANLNISFPDYMNSVYPKDFSLLFEEYKSKLF